MQNGSTVSGSNRTNRMLYGLIFLAMFMSLGHHIDHVIRGNHVGWPLTEHATPFTYSLGVYPLILLGLYLYASGRVGAGYWAIVSGSGALFLAAIHFGPTAVEPPAEIINLYEPRRELSSNAHDSYDPLLRTYLACCLQDFVQYT